MRPVAWCGRSEGDPSEVLPYAALRERDTRRLHLIQRALVSLVCLFAVLLFILSGLAILGIGLQSSVRAYVGGEGLWSKAEKDATISLAAYLDTTLEADYRDFEDHLLVQKGDRLARETLEQAAPDLALARGGLLGGRNHPDDVDSMMMLFRRFRWVPEMDHAIAVWAQGDRLIEELRALGERIHARVSGGPLSPEERNALRTDVSGLNVRLTILEDEFSSTLGDAARRVHKLLVGAIVAIALILAGIGMLATQQAAMLLSRNESALLASEQRYRDLFERSPAGLYRTTLDGKLLECNSALARLLGYDSTGELLQRSAADLYLDLADRKSFLEHLHDKRALVNCEVRLKRRGGAPLWGLLNERVIPGETPGEAVMEGSLIDITGRKEAEEATHHRASHDALTDLPNRALFRDRLALGIQQAQRRKETISVMFVDLDFFKRINDSLGHAAGDELLIQAAQRLKASLRAEDTVARMGGDEFMLFLSSSRPTTSAADKMAAKILGLFTEPFLVDGKPTTVSASIGISCYPDDGTDVDSLVASADKALYRAKQLGRNNFQHFEASLNRNSQASSEG